MPRISDDILDCVIYLYRSEEEAARGEKVGGSGFLVSVPAERVDGGQFHYAVSNRHVVFDTAAPVIRLNTQRGDVDILSLDVHHWTPHPDGDDIAVSLIGLKAEVHKFRVIPLDAFITSKIIDEHIIGPGDEAFMVGRFVNHQGKQRNIPSVRFGNISMMPWEALQHPIYKKDQESFIVEMRSISGYSGSPVLVHIPPFSVRPGGKTLTNRSFGPWLLGVDWGHIFDKQPVLNKYDKEMPEKWRVRSNSGMVGVVPSWKLAELLMDHPKLKAHRHQLEDDSLAHEAEQTSGVEVDATSSEPPTKDENPRHKEDFNSLLDAAVTGPQSADQT